MVSITRRIANDEPETPPEPLAQERTGHREASSVAEDAYAPTQVTSSESVSGLFKPGTNACATGCAHRVALLVDAAAYYDAFVRAARNARHSIMLVGWDFDSRTALLVDETGKPTLTLGPFLNELARNQRGLHIRLLEWDYPVIFGTDRELSPIYGLSWKPHRRVHFRFDDTHPLAGSHHQKIVVIDDRIAFVGGLDLTSRRWDTPAHRPDEPGRVFDGKPYPPMHDVVAAVDGEAARALGDVVRRRWLVATREKLPAIRTRHDPWPSDLAPTMNDVHFALACTAPPIADQPAVNQVERLYLDMIARARKSIYIENQYFTSQKIATALAERLKEPDGPEIVLVTRLLSHGWLEEFTMQLLRSKHVQDLRAVDRHGRFYACYPFIEGLTENTCIDMHAKVMIIDDEWLRVGSSNLSNRSMGVDTECDLVLQANRQPRLAAAILDFRNRLLAEHLDAEPEVVARAVEVGGSLRAAIDSLRTKRRTLAELEIVPPSEAAISAASLADMEKPVTMDRLVSELGAADTRSPEAKKRRLPWPQLLFAFVVIGSLTAAWRFTPLAEVVTADRVIEWTESFSRHWWAPMVLMALYTPASLVMFPRPLITLAAVVSFGPWAGLAYALIGVILASTAGYYAGRAFGRNTVRRLAGTRLNRISQALQRRGVLTITAVRLVPIAPFIVVSMVAGAIRFKLWQLSLGTILGMLPGALTATVLGDAAQSALRDSSQINWWFVGGTLAVLLTGSAFVMRWLSRMSEEPGVIRRTSDPTDSHDSEKNG